MARRKTVWQATVAGMGEFPIDMLRYDSCYPHSESDSGAIVRTQPFNADRAARGTEIVVEGYAVHGPTEGRWASFMWHVISWEWVR